MYTLTFYHFNEHGDYFPFELVSATSLSRLLKRLEYEIIHTRVDLGYSIEDSTSNPWKCSGVVRPQKLPLKK